MLVRIFLALYFTSATALALPHTCSNQEADLAAVAASFPQSLFDDYHEVFVGGHLFVKEMFACRADLDGNGSSDHLVAAFSNSVDTVLGVFNLDGTIVQLDEAKRFMGGKPTLHLEDLNGDHIPEIFLATASGPSMPVWMFRWEGRAVQSIGPVDASGETLLYEDVEFDDLTGDGLSEFLVFASAVDGPGAFGSYVYTYAEGTVRALGLVPWSGWFGLRARFGR